MFIIANGIRIKPTKSSSYFCGREIPQKQSRYGPLNDYQELAFSLNKERFTIYLARKFHDYERIL